MEEDHCPLRRSFPALRRREIDSGKECVWSSASCRIDRSLLHLDEFELHPVGAFEETHAAPAGHDRLLEDVNPARLELLDQGIEFVGVDGDMLDAVFLIALLFLEEVRYVERKPMQV